MQPVNAFRLWQHLRSKGAVSLRGSRQLSGENTGSNACLKPALLLPSVEKFRRRVEVCSFKEPRLVSTLNPVEVFGSGVGNFHKNLNLTSICDGLAYQNWRKVRLMDALLQKGSV